MPRGFQIGSFPLLARPPPLPIICFSLFPVSQASQILSDLSLPSPLLVEQRVLTRLAASPSTLGHRGRGPNGSGFVLRTWTRRANPFRQRPGPTSRQGRVRGDHAFGWVALFAPTRPPFPSLALSSLHAPTAHFPLGPMVNTSLAAFLICRTVGRRRQFIQSQARIMKRVVINRFVVVSHGRGLGLSQNVVQTRPTKPAAFILFSLRHPCTGP